MAFVTSWGLLPTVDHNGWGLVRLIYWGWKFDKDFRVLASSRNLISQWSITFDLISCLNVCLVGGLSRSNSGCGRPYNRQMSRICQNQDLQEYFAVLRTWIAWELSRSPLSLVIIPNNVSWRRWSKALAFGAQTYITDISMIRHWCIIDISLMYHWYMAFQKKFRSFLLIRQLLKHPHRKLRAYFNSLFCGLLKNIQTFDVWVKIGLAIYKIVQTREKSKYQKCGIFGASVRRSSGRRSGGQLLAMT